jgi:predicted N-formylglutamate amidohydrolase
LVANGDEVAVNEAWIDIQGDPATGMLLIGDHASNRVPAGIDLGVSTELMGQHVAIDIGVAPLGEALCVALGCPGILGGVSRLVIDLNREEDAPGLIPEASDGYSIPANVGLGAADKARRIAAHWTPYHDRIEYLIRTRNPKLLISLHSFTPRLATSAEARPWQIGILYNQDERAARIALPLLAQAGIVAGDNLPYSGKVLNATMNRHAEGNDIPYLGIEVRQDLIGDEAGVARWAGKLAPVIATTLAGLGG